MSNSTKNSKILVVDDSPETLEIVQRNLSYRGYKVFTAAGAEAAIRFLDKETVDLIITDLKMPGYSGLDLVRHVRENFKLIEIIMITGYPTIEGAVEAVKIGAEEYLAKPFTDEELYTAVKQSLEKLQIRKAKQSTNKELSSVFQGIIGQSPSMKKVFKSIEKAATTSATVLISGESGTGKELVARAIHYKSNRANAPFVPINCGGIPENLLESELFGYTKGSFTGANVTRAGFFQTADGGTIFLDEISETTLTMQIKLLRVLQSKEINMIGARRSNKIDVRILAATNRELYNLVAKGSFREDLFYRLNVLTIDLPPLRDRKDDIILLISHFTNKYSEELSKDCPQFTDRAYSVLTDYHWPGNVRELENIIQRLVLMNEDNKIDVPDLPEFMRYSVPKSASLERPLTDVEAEHISNVLASVNGNKTKAAEILQIDRKTLRNKIEKYNINI